MSRWAERILQEFPADLHRLWIATDPDDVLLDEKILSALRARGFEVLPFEDSVVFRSEYEERYRAAWDRGEKAPAKALVLHFRGTDVNELPWDYLQHAGRVSLKLADLFPKLSPGVVHQIGAQYFEPLFDAQVRYASQALGDAATKEFILTHIFRMSPHLMLRPEDMWRELLRLHYRDEVVPAVLSDHVAQVLDNQGVAVGLPTRDLFSSKRVLLRLLQAAWSRYLVEQGVTCTQIDEPPPPDYAADVAVPFDHPDIRVLIDSMFLDGTLHPVAVQRLPPDIPQWVRTGTVKNPAAMRDLVQEGIKSVMQELPTLDSTWRDWTQLSRRMGEVLARFHMLDTARADGLADGMRDLQTTADTHLHEWVVRHYADLPSLPAAKGPVMVHHVPRFLSMRRSAGEIRIALLVFDGLAVDQWVRIRESVAGQSQKFGFDEGACFAWLPTLTSVSRQALFSGLKPREFAETIETTAQEPALWSRFWQDQGLRANEVLYRKGIKRNEQLGKLEAEIADSTIKVAGIVVDTVDEMVHGEVLGKRSVASRIAGWCESGFVERLFVLLLDKGFHVYLTADHGNVEAIGQGRPNQGVAPELCGERVRTYRSETLAAESAAMSPNSYQLDVAGLPVDFIPLFAAGRTAFVPREDQVVVHGGVSVEELIVPFVKVSYVS